MPLLAIAEAARLLAAERGRRERLQRVAYHQLPAHRGRLLDRNGLEAGRCLFIDDSEKNVRGAEAVGMRAHHFRDAAGLAAALRALGLDAGPSAR